jgi:hypothetical protein
MPTHCPRQCSGRTKWGILRNNIFSLLSGANETIVVRAPISECRWSATKVTALRTARGAKRHVIYREAAPSQAFQRVLHSAFDRSNVDAVKTTAATEVEHLMGPKVLLDRDRKAGARRHGQRAMKMHAVVQGDSFQGLVIAASHQPTR